VSRTDMPGRQFIRALVTASFRDGRRSSRRRRLGIAGGPPTVGCSTSFYRFVTGADAGEHLFNIYSMTEKSFYL